MILLKRITRVCCCLELISFFIMILTFGTRTASFIGCIMLCVGIALHVLQEVDVFRAMDTLKAEIRQRCIDKNYPMDEISQLNGEFSSLLDELRYVSYLLSSLETRKIREDSMDTQAAYDALQAQINPHFLYNILDTIRGQALIDDADEVAKMVENLSTFFRYSISRTHSSVTLRDELENVNNYMRIQQYRFQDRFSLEIYMDKKDQELPELPVPRLILQPIVENAIVHGLKDKYRNGLITIEVQHEDDLIITVSDNGRGMNEEELEKLKKRIHNPGEEQQGYSGSKQKHGGIALTNVNERIRLMYGEEYGVSIYSVPSFGTKVELVLPGRKI
ncbi:MAG: histidine kinase [Lachnospiraceae bacterium]|nr:histidine kinase [Lachnospiraceae bacterium]